MSDFCCNGHEWTTENTRVGPTGMQFCRSCERMYRSKYRRKLRDARPSKPAAIPLSDAEWLVGREYEVRDCGHLTPCWVWLRAFVGAGYGVVYRKRGEPRILAHRLSYERARGTLPASLHVHHKCENKACINPEHLVALTQREHLTEHGLLVLGLDAAREVRRRAEAGEGLTALARAFGVTTGTIGHILRGESYADAA